MNHEQSRFAILPEWVRASYYKEPIFALYEAIAFGLHTSLSNYMAQRRSAPATSEQPKTKWTVQTWVQYKHSRGGFEYTPGCDRTFESKDAAECYKDMKEREELRRISDCWTEYRIKGETR